MSRFQRLLELTACAVMAGCAVPPADHANPGPLGTCGFNAALLTFAGDATAQARCLLRPVGPGGRVAAAQAELPAVFAALVGRPAGELRPRLARYLVRHHVADAAIGGSLDEPLSHARDDDPAAPLARYFVIHDTSTPWLGDAAAFPPDTAPALNDLARFAGPEAVAHVFVDRLGRTLLGHDLRVPWRATRLETRQVGTAARGLFLHVELAQPRRRDPAGAPGNDLIAPVPGFTDAQYAQLALIYAAASARRGDWLIPAFHAAIDDGIAGAHDDPQHFEIARFADALQHLRETLADCPAP